MCSSIGELSRRAGCGANTVGNQPQIDKLRVASACLPACLPALAATQREQTTPHPPVGRCPPLGRDRRRCVIVHKCLSLVLFSPCTGQGNFSFWRPISQTQLAYRNKAVVILVACNFVLRWDVLDTWPTDINERQRQGNVTLAVRK